MTRGDDYRTVVKRGKRFGGRCTLTYVVLTGDDKPSRFGFIVSKQVGGAVVRNTVRRRLKAASAEALAMLPRGADVVIRAFPSAATAGFGPLQEDVQHAVQRAAQ